MLGHYPKDRATEAFGKLNTEERYTSNKTSVEPSHGRRTVTHPAVIPAKAGIQYMLLLDARLRGHDDLLVNGHFIVKSNGVEF
jgi:hypothetical protein